MSKTFDFEEELGTASAEHVLVAPFYITLGEAEDVASFTAKYWNTIEEDNDEGEEPRLGLDSIGPKLKKSVIGEIRQLSAHARAAHTEAVLTTTNKKDGDTLEKSLFVASELRGGMKFVFDDGIEDEKDEQLAALELEHEDTPETFDGLALMLEQFGTLAKKYVKDLDGVGGFKAKSIDDAFELAQKLRAMPPVVRGLSPAKKSAYDKRNRYLNLLEKRLKLVRSSARFVFRQQPEIARLATSTYGRQMRADARRAEKKRKEAEAKEGKGPT